MTSRGTNWVDEALRAHEEHAATEEAAAEEEAAGRNAAGRDAAGGGAGAGDAGAASRTAGRAGTPSDREQQVPGGHFGRCPEGEEEAKVQRVPHIFVEQWLSELRWLMLAAYNVEPRLLQSEQLEMVDQEGA